MSTQISLAISKLISKIRKDPKGLLSIETIIARFYKSSCMGILVKDVSDDLENIFSQNKELFANKRLNDILDRSQLILKPILSI